MTLQAEELAKGSLRTRRPVLFWTWCALICFSIWQSVSTGLKVAGAERQAETGQLADYNQYMWDNAQYGAYFILANFATLFLLSAMDMGPRLSSYIAPPALVLIITGPFFFFAAWQFYHCIRDQVMEHVAYSCVRSTVPYVKLSFMGLRFNVTCAKEYAYAPHHVGTMSSSFASGIWFGAMSTPGMFFLMVLELVIRRPGLLTGAEVLEVPDEEEQELLNEKM